MDTRFTNSQLNTAGECERKAYLAYVQGIRPVRQSKALKIGDAVHIGLDKWYSGDKPTANEAAREASAHYLRRSQSEDRDAEAALAAAMVAAYIYTYDDQPYRVIASEVAFDLPLPNPVSGLPDESIRIAGKIDKIVEYNGDIVIMEHKTTTKDISPGSNYWRRLRIDSQVSMYIAAARAMGYQVTETIYDVIRRPTVEPCMLTQGDTQTFIETGQYHGAQFGVSLVENGATPQVIVNGVPAEVVQGKKSFAIRETPEMYGARVEHMMLSNPGYWFQRQIVGRYDETIKSHLWDVYESVMLMRYSLDNGYWPKRTRACFAYGVCPYFELCANNISGADLSQLPDDYYITDDVHEELKEERE